ncbi:hypothetical protein L1987_36098 [Smallanthus sonchifolius]|uniref:Uncharacterized protein n=1 Tax=Smallanthus sonchifolius TaxID=185202 RepID=A0ACB9HC95_9ASTR|nr:hypothetical protein L1987_36098 [Smallanthus sonchifolius]
MIYVLFLVFIITTQSIPSTSASEVYDVTGNKVPNNVPYYIGPVIWAKGGGIKLTDTKNNNKVCPPYVMQDPAEVNIGGHFRFTLSAYNQKYLLTSYGLGIDSGSPNKSTCDNSTFWQIPNAEAKAPSNLIRTGGLFETAVSCFQVVDYPKPTSPKVHSYMLQHCPYFCGAGPMTCFNVSIYEEKGVRYLASSGITPFEFVFQKPK